MRTLSNYAQKIEETIRYKYDPEGNVVNITAFSFTKSEYKLLNKNLNFIPTSKVPTPTPN